jgi:hypothetical protein
MSARGEAKARRARPRAIAHGRQRSLMRASIRAEAGA